MSSAQDSFYAMIKEHKMVEKNDQIVVGVSGGADSVCLLFLMKKLSMEVGFDITAVHVNHMLRGAEADRDEKFVKALCHDMDVRCVCVHSDVMALAREKKIGIEEAGRMVRYKAYDMVCRKLNPQGPYTGGKAAVAHHKDDNAETVLLNMIRGTDIKGLTGISPVAKRGNLTIIRPLLKAGKKDIINFLEENGVPYIEDSSNNDEDFARNRVRNVIIPQMEEINSKAVDHIDDMTGMLLRLSSFYDENVRCAMSSVVDMRDEAPAIHIDQLKYLAPALQTGVIYNTISLVAGTKKDISRVNVEDVLALADKQTGRRVELPYGIEAVRSYSNIIIRKEYTAEGYKRADIENAPITGLDAQFSISLRSLENDKKTFVLSDGSLLSFEIREVNDDNRSAFKSRNEYTKAFDCDKIKGTLILGKPQKDDKITFSGGTKSLKKFFVDEKVPQELRETIPVLKDMNGVLWVLGYRIGERYKITRETTKALVVSINGGKDER